LKPGLQRELLFPRIKLMTEDLSHDLDMARQFLRLITCKWSEVGIALSMEMRALGRRPQSYRFNPEKEDEVEAILEAAVQLNTNGSNIHVTVNPAPPFTSDSKTRALKDADIVAATATFLDADEPGIADKLPYEALASPDLAVITGLLPFTRAHFYWLLLTPVSDLARWKWFQKELAQRYGTDPAVCNPSRVMRLPGFLTHPNTAKREKGYVSELVRLSVLNVELA